MRRSQLLTATAAALALSPTAAAQAGTYEVQMCRLSDGTPAPVTGWQGVAVDTCAAGGSFGLAWADGAGVGASAEARLTTPANVAIARAELWRHFAAPASWQTAQPRVSSSWETRGWTGGGYTGDADDDHYNPASTAGRLVTEWPSQLRFGLGCLWSGDAVPNQCTGLIDYRAYKLDLTMVDNVAPQAVEGPSGALTGSEWLTGPRATMTVRASDVGAGSYRAFVRIGSTTRYALLHPDRASCTDAEPGAGTAYEFSELVPCPTASTLATPSFDLKALGDGTHANVTIGIEDAAGNERVLLSGHTLRVNAPGGALPDAGTACTNGTYDVAGVCRVTPPSGDDDDDGGGSGGGGAGGAGGGVTPAPVASGGGGGATDAPERVDPPAPQAPPTAAKRPNGRDATTAAVFELGADGAARREIRVRHGREVVVEGRLATPGGRPIAGAAIDVLSTARATPTQTRREPALSSGDDGRFRLVLAPGPSRVVRLAYRADLDDAEYAETAEIDVRVITVARLRARPKALRNGSAVRFRGTVAGAPRGSRKVVEMQVLQDGRWLTFATTRLRRGRFTHRYRFTRTVRPTTYVFRAIVRTESGWPYETGASNRTRVEVRP